MDIDMLLNMDGFDDNATPVFYDHPGATDFTVYPTSSSSDLVAATVTNPRSNFHPTASYRDPSQFCGNIKSWPPEANMYTYDFQDYTHHTTTDTPLQTSSDLERSLMSTVPAARSPEDTSWQMYLSTSPLHSLDLDNPTDSLVYPSHELTHERLSELGDLELLSSSCHVSDPEPASSTRPGRGLGGWTGTDCLQPPAAPSSTSRDSQRLLKRSRKPDESPQNLNRASKSRHLDEDSDDDYTPSRSPSLNPSRSISPSSPHPIKFRRGTPGVVVSTSLKRKNKKGKGKAKGSAALALAVVSQMIRDPSSLPGRPDVHLNYRYGVRRRKNQPIPLPIPVPNLNKKSRGRKVPYVANDNTKIKTESPGLVKEEEDEDDDDDESGGNQSRSSTTRSRKKSTRATSKASSSELESGRTFVCVISGCGKCFVRSEHLKRHVRSIHTHDKPHPCPFEGCDKSFSRRDNLGQHVRIHLQHS